MPDFMRPDISNVVLTQLVINGIYYIDAREAARKSMTTTTLSNLIMYAIHSNQNLLYYVAGQCYWFGEPEFIELMNIRANEAKLKEL